MKNAIFVIKPYKWNGMWVAVDQLVGCSLVLDRQFHRRLVGHWDRLLLPPHDDDKANARSQQKKKGQGCHPDPSTDPVHESSSPINGFRPHWFVRYAGRRSTPWP
jgi:hypothetical protein